MHATSKYPIKTALLLVTLFILSPASPAPNGLVARWTFDTLLGDTVMDVSGNGHFGLLKKVQSAAGVTGSSVRILDSGTISVQRHPAFNLDSTFTICAWFRLEYGGDDGEIMTRYRGNAGYRFGLSKGRKLYAQIGGDYIYLQDSLKYDKWYFVTLILNGTNMRIYVDARLAQSITKTGKAGISDSTLFIGSWFPGCLDEISVYGKALPPDSVKALYDKTLAAAGADTSAPLIFLIHSRSGGGCDTVHLATSFSDCGAQAWDAKDGNITSKMTVSGSVNVFAPGGYDLTYSVANALGKTFSIVRRVTVLPDTLPPKITLAGDKTYTIAINENFKDPGFTAIDYPSKKNMRDSVTITTDLDTAKAGTYTITYRLTDFPGLKDSVARTVIVQNDPLRKEIWINQLGFYPDQRKAAWILNTTKSTFDIIRRDDNAVVFTGTLSNQMQFTELSQQFIKIADFSGYTQPGEYVLRVADFGHSCPFTISWSLYRDVAHAGVKAFFYQRCSTPISAAHGGVYAREAGHPDNACPVFGSEQEVWQVSGGWYDAGDYGKYVVNGGITVGTLLSLYELAPDYFKDASLDIPESGNGKSDLLDEVKWELDWFKKMQDTSGAVAFKVGPLKFPPFIMPVADTAKRYVIGKAATASTLNFAAVMAQAGRVYRTYDSSYAADCLQRAEKAWKWAYANRDVLNPEEGSGTGLYEDMYLDDEFFWAGSELYVTTGKEGYRPSSGPFPGTPTAPASWNSVANLGLFTLACAGKERDSARAALAKTRILDFAATIQERFTDDQTRTPLSYNYYWGSNGTMCNYAVSLAYGYYLTKNTSYLEYLGKTLDYLFGKNPTGYSFVTGFGSTTPLHPHHRVSGADAVALPIPGFLAGGVNSRREDVKDSVLYPRTEGCLSYVDVEGSYASNEVAINWNAPLVFATAFMDIVAGKSIPVGKMVKRDGVAAALKRVSFAAYPFHLRCEVQVDQPASVCWKLIDIRGRTVDAVRPYNVETGPHVLTVPLKAHAGGVYLLRISAGTSVYFKKVVVK